MPITISPSDISLAAGQVVKFAVSGADASQVTWGIQPAGAGVFLNGTYIAPPEVTKPEILTVSATASDGSTAEATILLICVSVAIEPATVCLHAGESQKFAAFVQGDPNSSVTWLISPGAGAISDEGVYTPPATPPESGVVTVTAVSKLDPAQSARAQITLVKPSPMSLRLRRFLGNALIVGIAALCLVLLWCLPVPHYDLAELTNAAQQAQQQAAARQTAAEKARQDLQATKDALAKSPSDKALQSAVKDREAEATSAAARETVAAADAKEKLAAQTEAEAAFVYIPASATPVSRELVLLILVLVLGALGSLIHTARSFAGFAGNRTLVASWGWWYLLHPVVGMALAVIFYTAIRAGFLTSASASAVSPYGVAALAGLTGMFSKQASDKLSEVFTVAFQTREDAQRKDKMGPAQPPPAKTTATQHEA